MKEGRKRAKKDLLAESKIFRSVTGNRDMTL